MVVQLDADIKKKMAGLKRAMGEAADGKVLKRELSKRLRSLMTPIYQRGDKITWSLDHAWPLPGDH